LKAEKDARASFEQKMTAFEERMALMEEKPAADPAKAQGDPPPPAALKAWQVFNQQEQEAMRMGKRMFDQ
jgi:hypothetical protein